MYETAGLEKLNIHIKHEIIAFLKKLYFEKVILIHYLLIFKISSRAFF